jgi:hypothetical protein
MEAAQQVWREQQQGIVEALLESSELEAVSDQAKAILQERGRGADGFESAAAVCQAALLHGAVVKSRERGSV